MILNPDYPHITRHARMLRVHRTTLWRALKGKHHNPKLVEDYNALLAREKSGERPRVTRLPAGAALEDCTPEQLEEAKREFGEQVRIEGSSIVLCAPFQLFLDPKPRIEPVSAERAGAETQAVGAA